MDKARILAEVTPDIAAALTCLQAHGFPAPWEHVAFHVTMRVGQCLRLGNGDGGRNKTIRQLMCDRYRDSPAVMALMQTLPTDRTWSATLLAPVINAYFGLEHGAETLRQSMPPGDPLTSLPK